MTRIALIAMLLPAFLHSTEAVSAPVLYRSQSASSVGSTNQVRRQRVANPSTATPNGVSNPNQLRRQRPINASGGIPNIDQVQRTRVVPITNDLPRGMVAKLSPPQQRTNSTPSTPSVFQNPDLIPLGEEVFPSETFAEYKAAPFSAFNPGTAFKIETAPKPTQAPFKATLVGVNINAWLENPDMHQVLIKVAEEFPIPRLLDNIVQNNPEIALNNPQLTERLLSIDIYGPYLSKVANPPKLPPLFKDYRSAIAFTRNYNIYGASAGGLPYFGTPTEGTDRQINLSVNRHQFREYAARFPDTDIFLVATINISPNWLEESWDIRQENRQFADIFIYAFNRRGKLLGGGGISQFFIKGGQFVTLSQRVYSKYWQPAIPRVFYITPSFKIINTAVPGSKREPATRELEISQRPYLNSTQRYILTSIENLRATHQKVDVELFDTQGNRTYKHVIPPTIDKPMSPFLARRKFILNIDTNAKPVFNYSSNILAELNGTASRYDFITPAQKDLLTAKQDLRRTSSTNIQKVISTTDEPTTKKAKKQKVKNLKNTNSQEMDSSNAEKVISATDEPTTKKAKKQKAKNLKNTNSQEMDSSNVEKVIAPVDGPTTNKARKQKAGNPNNTNSQEMDSRTNLPATNQGRPRRAPTNSTLPIESLQSSLPLVEYLAQADPSFMWDFVISPLSFQEIEYKAQNTAPLINAANQPRRRRAAPTDNIPQDTLLSLASDKPITNLTKRSPTTTNGAPRNASIIDVSEADQARQRAAATEPSENTKKTKKSQKEKTKILSPAEQLQQTEDKIQETREKKFAKDQAKLKKAMGIRRYFPSNEEAKLKEMIETVSQRLKEAPFFTTNDLQAVTNPIPPFELETDPAVYRNERKKYYSIPTSVSRFKRNFAKETKILKSALAARLNDELYWANLHRKILIENNLWTPLMETQHLAFKKHHQARKKVELVRFMYHRDSLFNKTISNEIQSYLDRSIAYAQQTIKPKKQLVAITKLQKQAQIQFEKSYAKYQKPSYLDKLTAFKDRHQSTLLNFAEVTKEYVDQKPKDLTIPFLLQDETNTREQLNQHRQEWTALARRNRVPLQVIAFGEISKQKYPTLVYLKKMENAARREYKKNMRFIIYEGYIFVLSGKWRVKTSLADRLDVL